MKTILIMLPQPILVSDEEITKNTKPCYCYNSIKNTWDKDVVLYQGTMPMYHYEGFKKIISGIEGLPKLNLSAIAERIGWVDIKMLAYNATKKRYPQDFIEKRVVNEFNSYWEGYEWGFKAAQSLNEKNYTKSDVIKAMEYALENQCPFQVELYQYFIDDLSKPKEYQVEYTQEANTIKVTKIL